MQMNFVSLVIIIVVLKIKYLKFQKYDNRSCNKIYNCISGFFTNVFLVLTEMHRDAASPKYTSSGITVIVVLRFTVDS